MKNIVMTTTAHRLRTTRSLAALALAALFATLTYAGAASGGIEPPPTSDATTETTLVVPDETVSPETPIDTTPPPGVIEPTTPDVETPATEPPPPEAPAIAADVAMVEVLEEIPVVAAAEDDFGASRTFLRVHDALPLTYGQAVQFEAVVGDDSASCSFPFFDCNPPHGSVEFLIDGQNVATRPLVEVEDRSSITETIAWNVDAGEHLFEARYIPGDFDSSSNSETHHIAKAGCTASFSQTAERSTVGDNPIFVANVTGPSQDGPPSGGLITIRDQNGRVVREVTKPAFADTFIGINTLPTGVHTLTFTYSGDNNHNACSSSTSVTHTVSEVVDAVDDTYVVDKGGIHAPVLDNDAYGQDVTISAVTNGGHGIAYANTPSTIAYGPDPDFAGTDTITYTLTNAAGQSDTATVTFHVTPPQAVDDTATVAADASVVVAVLANDVGFDAEDTLKVFEAEHGTAVINADSTVTYTPDSGFTGTDTFEYRMISFFTFDAATVTITVEADPPPTAPSTSTSTTSTTTTTTVPSPTPSTSTAPPAGNSAPVVVADTFQVTAAQLLVVAPGVLANDVDPDGQRLTAAVGTNPANGTLVLAPDGSFTYTPDAGFIGRDSFTYVASDGQAATTALGFAGAGRSRALTPALTSEPVVVTIIVNPAAPPVPTGTLPATR